MITETEKCSLIAHGGHKILKKNRKKASTVGKKSIFHRILKILS
jgi:hypothetical protein